MDLLRHALIPLNEAERLRVLSEYDILDSLPEKGFDDITRIAAQICQTPIALVSLIDAKRQWFKSCRGLQISETARELAICSHAILHPDVLLEVPDTRLDARFANNVLLQAELGVIPYAGVPLVNPEGFALGTLCVLDYQPRQLSPDQRESLKALANQVMAQLELRRKVKQLKESQQELTQFAFVVAHDLKAPLNQISSLAQLITLEYGKQMGDEGTSMIQLLNLSAQHLSALVTGILNYSTASNGQLSANEPVALSDLLDEVVKLLSSPDHFEFRYAPDLPTISTSRTALTQIFLNLFSNAIKYCDQEKGWVEVHFSQTDSHYQFEVSDNGPGIREEDHQKIFELFQNLGKKDRNNHLGTGIGLATVKKLVTELGGTIRVVSPARRGTTFVFTHRK